MTKINLKDYYPHYKQDTYVDVSDEVADFLKLADNKMEAYRIRTFRHKAYYSLDYGDGIERHAVHKEPCPSVIYDQKQEEAFYATAIAKLPKKQAMRIYMHFYLGMSKTEIAKAEGVHISTVGKSIGQAIKILSEILK